MKRKPTPRETNETEGMSYDEYRRTTCTLLLFWTVCGSRCRRAKACMGDPHACFKRWWPHVPEEVKNWFRFSIKARQAGMTPAEASRHVKAEMARWNEIERGWGPNPYAPASATAATPVEPAP